MATPARPAPALHSSATVRSPLARFFRAGVLIVVVACACYFAVRLVSPKVRDYTPTELKAKLDEGVPIDQAIEQVNRLTPEGRRDVLTSPEAQSYLNKLKPDQRLRFVKETLDRGIRQQLEHYQKLTPEERIAFRDEVLTRQREERKRLENDPEHREQVHSMVTSGDFEAVMERAVQSFLSITSSQERVELKPLFEGALDNLKYAREEH